MSFLLFDSFTHWLSGVADNVLGTMYHSLRSLFYWITSYIYELVALLYRLFENFCNARVLNDKLLGILSQRVGLVLGVVMLFYVILSFVKMLIDPDTITDNNKGAVGIIKRVIIVIVMLGVGPFVFKTLYFVQGTIVSNHVISRLFIPEAVDTVHFGNAFSAELFTSFYSVDRKFLTEEGSSTVVSSSEEASPDESSLEGNPYIVGCVAEYGLLKRRIYEDLDFNLGNNCLNVNVAVESISHADGTVEEYEGEEFYVMKFNIILSLGVGVFAAYMLFSYCISVGVRMISLAFLEIISPMAFVSYLAPKEDTFFKRWLKLYGSLYLDAFIRIAIINFVTFLIAAILGVNNEYSSEFYNTVGAVGVSDNLAILVKVFLVISLLTFAKKAPNIMKELFPNAASKLGLGGWHFKDALGLSAVPSVAGMGVGMAVGSVANGAIGMVDRAVMAHRLGKGALGTIGAGLSGIGSGFIHGTTNGVKNKGRFWKNIPAGFKAQHESDLSYEELIATGGSARGRFISGVSEYVGETKGQMYQRLLGNYSKISGYMKQGDEILGSISSVKSAYDAAEQAQQYEWETVDEFRRRKQDYVDIADSMRDAAALVKDGDKSYAYTKFEMETVKNTAGKMITRIKRDANGKAVLSSTIENVSLTAKDETRAADYRGVLSEAQSYINSRSISDSDGRTIEITDPSSRVQLDAATKRAEKSRVAIVHTSGYARAIANDKAAGVADKRGFNGPKNS